MNNNFSFYFILFSLIFGVVLYDQISLMGFTYIDEIIALLLFVECIFRKKIGSEYRKFLFLSLLFLLYSIIKTVNTVPAAFTDFFIITKPFIAFYSVYYMGLQLNDKHKSFLRRIIIMLALVFFFGALVNYDLFVWTIPIHASRFATMMVIFAFMYYYCTKRDKSSILLTIAIMSVSLLSLRSKAYGFFTIVLFSLYFFNSKKFKLNIISMVGAFVGIFLVIFVSWEKISFYFMEGAQSDYIEDYMARPALYSGAVLVLKDYPIMGPGLGTYASYASAKYYSPLYAHYNLDKVHGLNEEGSFITDAFFPSLAQYGIIGIFFFFFFFYRRYLDIKKNKLNNGNVMWFKMSLLFLVFFFIESTSDSTLAQNRGLVMMILFAMYLKDKQIPMTNKLTRKHSNLLGGDFDIKG